MKVPNFLPNGAIDQAVSLCTLVIDVYESHAQVMSEHQCAGFGGAGASFVEQGRNLRRVP
jgi:hypothetical protein